MRHFPATRHPPHLAGLTHSRAPLALPRKTAWLLAAVIFVAGFFLGAILFGAALVHSENEILNASNLPPPTSRLP